MIDTGYLFSKDSSRIFINTCLGCTGQCAYCYLGKMGYDNKRTVSPVKKAEDLIQELEEKVKFSKETLITLGCFSECWDENNKQETIKLIKYFLKRGNQIQLSTKKQVSVQEIEQFKDLINYLGQLVILVSSATISGWKEFEKGTDYPEKRFKTFEVQKSLPIPTVLYMKPVLKSVTIRDVDLYKQVIKAYNLHDIVVGSIFGEKETDETVHFSNKRELFYNPISEETTIKQSLRQINGLRVFSRSTEAMHFYKEKYKEEER